MTRDDPGHPPRARQARRAPGDVADLQVFRGSRRGDSNPGPPPYHAEAGIRSRGTQSRLPSGVSRITTCRDRVPDPARYRPIPTVSAPNGRLGVSLASEAMCRLHGATPPFTEAVAQTSDELAGSVLRVGTENGHLLRHARAGRRDVVALNRAGAHFRERAAAFPKRLCATASTRSRSELAGLDHCWDSSAAPASRFRAQTLASAHQSESRYALGGRRSMRYQADDKRGRLQASGTCLP